MEQINPSAVIAAGIVGYFPGALWYSPLLFLRPWSRAIGRDPDRSERHGGRWQVPVGMVASIASAAAFAFLLGPDPTLGRALAMALACAGGLIAPSFAIQYVFEGRAAPLWAINAGYHLVQFLLFGSVLALWP